MLEGDIIICPHCDKPFVLGKNGVVGGCDSCLDVVRDTYGTLVYPPEMRGMLYSHKTVEKRNV